jgi:hypothetical protein
MMHDLLAATTGPEAAQGAAAEAPEHKVRICVGFTAKGSSQYIAPDHSY